MKKLNSIFFILFLLLITGGFAAIAQNVYGITLLGWGLAGFAIFSLLGGVLVVFSSRYPQLLAYEYFLLTLLFAIIALRTFLIHFSYVELIFSMTGIGLVVIYIFRILSAVKTLWKTNQPLAASLILLYSSVAIYSLAMLMEPFSIIFAQIIGLIAFLTFLFSLLSVLRVKAIILREKEVKWTRYLAVQPNRAVLLMSFFLLITFYTTANYFNIVPDIQSSKMPKGYYKLAKEAENGTDIAKNGKFRYQDYRERLESFTNKQGLKN